MTENEIFDLQDDGFLLDCISAKVHEEWSRNRIADGWAYGEERNDFLKQTPCLVPYGRLSESEKEYDRNTVRCVIRSLQEFGFTIRRCKTDGKEP